MKNIVIDLLGSKILNRRDNEELVEQYFLAKFAILQ